jgi:shikimate dehydrogenase
MPARVNELRSCVIGWPISHSRSPLIHNYWLNHYGIAGEYIKQPVSPGELEAFLCSLGARGFLGCNVTVPHKERTAQFVTLADPLTRKLFAVNTLYLENGVLMGTNTDGFGFIKNLAAAVPDFGCRGSSALLLGAGGAARAIAGALLHAGLGKLVICNRSLERARAVASIFGGNIIAAPWDSATSAMRDIDLLVNATALGMEGKPPLDLSLETLPRSAVVCDIVYVPLETPLLRQARGRGNRTVDGIGMLLHQACPAFEKWYGIRPEVTTALRRKVENDILAQPPLAVP